MRCNRTSALKAALDEGKFKDEIVPLTVTFEELDEKGRKQKREVTFEKDEGVRRDSSIEGLAKLKPAFHIKGTITAGNASQMSDGAAAAVVMSDSRAKESGIETSGALHRLRDCRMPARRDGHRACLRYPESSQDGWTDA